jgi:uncharacterized protein (DUF1800 family)
LAGLSRAQAQQTLSRLTYGPSSSSTAALQKLGLAAWLKDQLNPKKTEAHAGLKDLSSFPTESMSPAQLQAFYLYKIKPNLMANELAQLTLLRRLYSSRQVFEMLVEHFSDYVPVPFENKRSFFRGDYDNNVIRKHALGNYPDLLVAAAFHPGMLKFLNGNTNTAEHPNENFGREFLELFTITPGAGYTEKDVQSAAKMFSGVTFEAATGVVLTRVKQHYFGSITVFGYTDQNATTASEAVLRARIEKMIRHFAMLPQTANAFSVRMARRFVADVPPASLIKKMSAAYLASGGSIPNVFKTMAESAEFSAAKPSKVKRPMEHLSSTVRALDLQLSRAIPKPNLIDYKTYANGSPMPAIQAAVARQGHAPFEWPFPNGYPDAGEPWTTLTSQVQRWNLSNKLANGKLPNVFEAPDYEAMIAPASQTPTAIVRDLAVHFFGAPLAQAEARQIEAMLEKGVKKSLVKATYRKSLAAAAAAVLLSKPDWNLR